LTKAAYPRQSQRGPTRSERVVGPGQQDLADGPLLTPEQPQDRVGEGQAVGEDVADLLHAVHHLPVAVQVDRVDELALAAQDLTPAQVLANQVDGVEPSVLGLGRGAVGQEPLQEHMAGAGDVVQAGLEVERRV
jgi:hypothetical protein